MELIKGMKLQEIFLIPNLLSISRIVFSPIVFYTLSKDYQIWSLILFLWIIASDFLDGFASRLLKMETPLGKILDPLADKIAIGFLSLALFLYWDFPFWLFFVIVFRDLGFVFFGYWIYKKKGILFTSNSWGKYTTLFLALSGLSYFFPENWGFLFYIFLTVSVVFFGISTFFYIQDFIYILRSPTVN